MSTSSSSFGTHPAHVAGNGEGVPISSSTPTASSSGSTTVKITFLDKIEPALSHHRGTTVAISIAYGLFGLSHLWRGNLLTAAALLAPLGAVIKVAYPKQQLYVKSFLDDVWAPTAAAIQRLGESGLTILKGNKAV